MIHHQNYIILFSISDIFRKKVSFVFNVSFEQILAGQNLHCKIILFAFVGSPEFSLNKIYRAHISAITTRPIPLAASICNIYEISKIGVFRLHYSRLCDTQ